MSEPGGPAPVDADRTSGISSTPPPEADNTSLGAKAASRLGVEPVTAPRLT